MDRAAIDFVTNALLARIHAELKRATGIADAARLCGESGNIRAAVKIAMDVEEPAYLADRLLKATLLMRGELLDETLD